MELKNGYAVLCIPESGLFVKNGEVVTGRGEEIVVSEMVLYSRRADADLGAKVMGERWKGGDRKGQEWNFLVIPVLVHERI